VAEKGGSVEGGGLHGGVFVVVESCLLFCFAFCFTFCVAFCPPFFVLIIFADDVIMDVRVLIDPFLSLLLKIIRKYHSLI